MRAAMRTRNAAALSVFLMLAPFAWTIGAAAPYVVLYGCLYGAYFYFMYHVMQLTTVGFTVVCSLEYLFGCMLSGALALLRGTVRDCWPGVVTILGGLIPTINVRGGAPPSAVERHLSKIIKIENP